jgi:CRP/FNR family transcriptional regulator, polysaccharide utilization system transcription regulator
MFFNTILIMQYKNSQIEACLESPSSLLKTLSQKEKESLVQHHTIAHYRKGEILFKDGEKSHGLICLASGKVKVFKIGVGGREQILHMVRPTEFMGFRAMFSNAPYPAYAEALEDSTICIFEKDVFIKIVKKNIDLALKLLKILSEEIKDSNDRIISLTQKHIRGRLAESLTILRDTYGLDTDGKTINALLSREDIAHLSNMTTSNAIRTLSIFASEEIIALEGRKIMILDGQRLDKISELG